MKEARIRQKIWNIEEVIEDIKMFPQTYDTVLKEHKKNRSLQFLLRKKLNKLNKRGKIFRCRIPGTRFGQMIFFDAEKEYNILVENCRRGINVYTFFDFYNKNDMVIKVDELGVLRDTRWQKMYDKEFSNLNVLKFI